MPPSAVAATSPQQSRSERVRRSILVAAGDVLERDGFIAMTMDAVAAEARASKATLHRHWPNKASLAADAFLAEVDPTAPVPDTGAVEDDLRRQVRAVVRAFARGRVHHMLIGVLTALPTDPDLQRAFRERYMRPRRDQVAEALRRGLARGEIDAGIDEDAFSDALYAPLYLRLLTGGSLTRADADRAVSQALYGVAMRDQPRRRRTITTSTTAATAAAPAARGTR